MKYFASAYAFIIEVRFADDLDEVCFFDDLVEVYFFNITL